MTAHPGEPDPDAGEVIVACPSLAVDRTLLVESFVPGLIHRPAVADTRGGGKGGNVARSLLALGTPVHLVGLVGLDGDPAGEFVVRDLRRAGARVTALAGGPTRTCTTVVDASTGVVTAFYERAAPCPPGVWPAFAEAVLSALAPAPAQPPAIPASGRTVLVLTGSVPPGVEPAEVGALAARARDHATVVCDLTGEFLAAALGSRPDVVTPNTDEAREAIGLPAVHLLHGTGGGAPEGREAGVAAAACVARALVTAGARAAVVSAGALGAVVVGPGDGSPIHLPSPPVTVNNPTGAGDVLTATLADGLRRGQEVGVAAVRAVALAAASCSTFAAADLPAGAGQPSRRP